MSLYGPQVSHRTATAAVRLRIGVDAQHSTSRATGHEQPCGSTLARHVGLSRGATFPHALGTLRALKTLLGWCDAIARERGEGQAGHGDRGSRRRHGPRGAPAPYSLIQGIKSGKAKRERAEGGLRLWMANPAKRRKEHRWDHQIPA